MAMAVATVIVVLVVVVLIVLFGFVVVTRVVAANAAARVEGLGALDGPVGLDLGLFVLIRRLGLLEDGDKVLAL